jgi:hypothetical protein
MRDVVRMDSQYGDVRFRVACQYLSSNPCSGVKNSGDLVAFGCLDHMRVGHDDAT